MSSLAFNYIVNLLSRREYSEFELRNKMQEKNFSEEEIDDALSLCQAKKLAKRSSFFRKLSKFTLTKGCGVGRIRQELRQLKGVSSDIIDEVLMESEIDWYEMAENLLRKKIPKL